MDPTIVGIGAADDKPLTRPADRPWVLVSTAVLDLAPARRGPSIRLLTALELEHREHRGDPGYRPTRAALAARAGRTPLWVTTTTAALAADGLVTLRHAPGCAAPVLAAVPTPGRFVRVSAALDLAAGSDTALVALVAWTLAEDHAHPGAPVERTLGALGAQLGIGERNLRRGTAECDDLGWLDVTHRRRHDSPRLMPLRVSVLRPDDGTPVESGRETDPRPLWN